MKKKILDYLEKVLGDISPDTIEIYKNRFENMSDAEVKKYVLENPIRLYADDKDVTSAKLDRLIKTLNIVPQERLYLPYKGDNVITKNECMVFPVQIRRLQQLASKQSKSNFTVVERDRTGQATGDSKIGKLTDSEVNQLVGMGLDKVLTELMSPRSDNLSAKQQMNEQLREKLTFSLNDISINKTDKNTLLYIDAMYKCINLATDFIDSIYDIS